MYTPTQKIIDNYARVLVRFALNSGKGVRAGETVYLIGNEVTKPLFMACRREIYKAGGHVIMNYLPDNADRSGADRDLYTHASLKQITHFPKTYHRGLIDEIDHLLYLIAETDMQALAGIDPKGIMARGAAFKPFMDWRNKKESAGRFTWTLALYGTAAMAKEARLSEEEYWGQIIDACFLKDKDPIATWRKVFKDLHDLQKKLNRITPLVKHLHVQGPDADLKVTLGEKRAWLAGSGRNIPSFELFTSPDWRGTEGWIRFNQPLYRYGNLIEGVELHFKGGKVVKSSAKKNEKLLKEMIATKNANKIGEYSLTDRRFSRITKFMAETLFDENIGGPHGNTHIALGSAYKDCYDGDHRVVTEKQWEKLGYNDSSVHTDIVSTAPRIVTAHFKDGKQKVIYENGQFTL